MSIGVPIKLLHEAQGHIITIELKTGSVYRGTLFEGNGAILVLHWTTTTAHTPSTKKLRHLPRHD